MLKRVVKWGVNKFIIILSIMFGIVSNPDIFYVGAFLIWYLILFSPIFFIGGFILLYYIILVLILLRSASGSERKNLSDRAWVFSFNKIAGGLFKSRSFNN